MPVVSLRQGSGLGYRASIQMILISCYRVLSALRSAQITPRYFAETPYAITP
jgi:hypothetical protein